jgi:hypothetical protein
MRKVARWRKKAFLVENDVLALILVLHVASDKVIVFTGKGGIFNLLLGFTGDGLSRWSLSEICG